MAAAKVNYLNTLGKCTVNATPLSMPLKKKKNKKKKQTNKKNPVKADKVLFAQINVKKR